MYEPSHSPRGAGFTLIELLVVISIISLLIAILFPALGKARQSAQQIACASNVRQIMLTTQYYLDDYRDTYMPYGYNSAIGVATPSSGANYPEVANPPISSLWTWLLFDLEYTSTTNVFLCPTFVEASADASNRGSGGRWSYGYNYVGSTSLPARPWSFAGSDRGGFGLRVSAGREVLALVRTASVEAPSSSFVLGDSISYTGAGAMTGSARLDHPFQPTNPQRAFGNRHNGGGNAGWADGHVTAESHENMMSTAWANRWTRWQD